jgi:hypothetical protein
LIACACQPDHNSNIIDHHRAFIVQSGALLNL